MLKYKPVTAMQIFLRLLDYAIENDTYAEVLNVLGQGIKASSERIDLAANSGEYADAVTDTEIEIVEGLLGAAYVVCQTQITAVTQAALRCRAQSIADGVTFNAFGDREHELRVMGPRFDAQWSKIELLWSLANYFKHRDEWSSATWTNPKGLEQHTIPVIRAAGLKPSSNGNLRSGAEALGNPTYEKISVFEAVIREWADHVRQAIRQAAGL